MVIPRKSGFHADSCGNKYSPRLRLGLFGDPYGTRTHVTAVKGRCLNHLTNGPGSGNLTRTDDTPGMNRMLYQLSYAAINAFHSKGNYTSCKLFCQSFFSFRAEFVDLRDIDRTLLP